MGNRGWNHEGTKTACEIFWSGEIGDVKELHAFTGGIYGGQPNIPAAGPEARQQRRKVSIGTCGSAPPTTGPSIR